jgi:hypothetical protein
MNLRRVVIAEAGARTFDRLILRASIDVGYTRHRHLRTQVGYSRLAPSVSKDGRPEWGLVLRDAALMRGSSA